MCCVQLLLCILKRVFAKQGERGRKEKEGGEAEGTWGGGWGAGRGGGTREEGGKKGGRQASGLFTIMMLKLATQRTQAIFGCTLKVP